MPEVDPALSAGPLLLIAAAAVGVLSSLTMKLVSRFSRSGEKTTRRTWTVRETLLGTRGSEMGVSA